MRATTLLQTVLNPVKTQSQSGHTSGPQSRADAPPRPPHPLNPASQDGLSGHKRSTFLVEREPTDSSSAHVLILAVRLLRNNNLFCK